MAGVTHPLVGKIRKALAGNGYQLDLPFETADGQQMVAATPEGSGAEPVPQAEQGSPGDGATADTEALEEPTGPGPDAAPEAVAEDPESTARQGIEAEPEEIVTADADPDVTGAPEADPDEDAVAPALSDVSAEQILAVAIQAHVEHACHRIHQIKDDVEAGELDVEQAENGLTCITTSMDETVIPACTTLRSAAGEVRAYIRKMRSEASHADDHAA